MLTRYRRVNVEGARLLLGQWWDVRTRSWLPLYPDLIAQPRHTPAGAGGARERGQPLTDGEGQRQHMRT